MKRFTVVSFLMLLGASLLTGYSATASAHAKSTNAVDITQMRLVDISYVQEAVMPVDPALALPKLTFFSSIEKGGTHNLEVISYCPHTGTHMDSPYHVNPAGITLEKMNPTLLIGPAAVISLNVSGNYVIPLADIQAWEAKNGPIQQGDGVLLDTRQDELWDKGRADYIDAGYPTLSKEAAAYLVSKKIRYVGMETISPEGASTEIHKMFLGNGIGVVENLTHLSQIGAPRCYTIGTFPAVDGASGAWVRLLAFVEK